MSFPKFNCRKRKCFLLKNEEGLKTAKDRGSEKD